MSKVTWISNQVPEKAFWGLAWFCFAVSVFLVAFSPSSLIYDEIHYHPYATQLQEKGFGLVYVRELAAPPGPLSGIVHYLLAWVTELRIVPMRVATSVLFALSAVAIASLLAGVRSRNASAVPALAFGIPFAGMTFGLALTEVPAMLAASLAILGLTKALLMMDELPASGGIHPVAVWLGLYALVAVAGFFYAGAVWGRQNYLAAVLALPILFFSRRGFCWMPWIIVTAMVCGLSALLFAVWGGLVPEAVRFVSDGSKDALSGSSMPLLNLSHGIYGLGYAGILFGVLSPRVFAVNGRLISASAVMSIAAVIFPGSLRALPSKFLLERLIGPAAVEFAGVAFGLLFSFLGFWLLLSVVERCYQLLWPRRDGVFSDSAPNTRPKGSLLHRLRALEMKDKLYLFACLAWLLILASNMKILHQFNSRYVVVAAPFLLITASRHFEPTRGAVLRLIAGFTMSMIFLINCYKWL